MLDNWLMIFPFQKLMKWKILKKNLIFMLIFLKKWNREKKKIWKKLIINLLSIMSKFESDNFNEV